MVQDMVVEGEVVAGDAVNADILLNPPVSKTESLGLCQQTIPRQFICPICLIGLLQLPVSAYAGEAKNR